jgi:ketosteroid isomerase-like protein
MPAGGAPPRGIRRDGRRSCVAPVARAALPAPPSCGGDAARPRAATIAVRLDHHRMRRLSAPVALLLLTAACGGAPERGTTRAGTRAATTTDEASEAALGDTLVARIRDAYDLRRADPLPHLLALYPAEGPVISAAGGRVTATRAAVAGELTGFWTRVGQYMRDPRFVVGDRHVTRLGPDAAVLTLTYAIPHRTPENRPHTIAGAWTAVFQRRAGRWMIVQEHLSDLRR